MKTSDSNKVWRAGSYSFGELTARRIFLPGDSLTEGSGGSTFRTQFMSRLRAKFGDGGVGIGHIDDTREGAFALDNVTGTDIAGISSWADSRRTKSFFGRGRYWNNAAAGTLNKQNLAGASSPYGSVTLWVEFTNSSQTVKIKPYFGAGTKEITYTASSFALNTPVPLHFPLSVENTSYVGIAVTVNTNGANDLFIWADDWHLTTPTSGVQFTNAATGGSSIADWVSLDAARFATWMSIVRPYAMTLDLGMNDRGSGLSNANPYIDKIPATAPVYRNMETLVQRFQSGYPKVRGLLIAPNDTDDRATTIIGYYPEMYRAIAADAGWAFFNDQDLLGLFAAAVAAGYMVNGNVHPTSLGNDRRGNAYADVFSLA
ncbi:hypothetical protein SR18_gp051c [Caulobacter phage SR18]|nr:hypothetical protein SR18_gp051c [Caulobacter phage SR18]